MSISSVTQTITAAPVATLATGIKAQAPAAAASAQSSFATASLGSGTSSVSTLSGNPITALSSDLQSFLLQQQGQGSAHSGHHGGHRGGTHVDSPALPGGGASGAIG